MLGYGGGGKGGGKGEVRRGRWVGGANGLGEDSGSIKSDRKLREQIACELVELKGKEGKGYV